MRTCRSRHNYIFLRDAMPAAPSGFDQILAATVARTEKYTAIEGGFITAMAKETGENHAAISAQPLR